MGEDTPHNASPMSESGQAPRIGAVRRLLTWIGKNKEWFLSGIGVWLLGIVGTVLLLLGGYVYHAFRSRTVPDTSAETTPTESDPFTKPSPDDMVKELDEFPSAQQAAAAETYKGVRVFWAASFDSMEQEQQGKWNVALDTGMPGNLRMLGTNYVSIICTDVDLDTNPRMKFAHKGDLVYFHGTIHSVSDHQVLVGDVSMEDISRELSPQ